MDISDHPQDLKSPELAAEVDEELLDKKKRTPLMSKVLAAVDTGAKVFFVGAVILGIIEYLDVKKNRRVAASYNLVENWEQDGYQDSYRRISKRISKLIDIHQEQLDAEIDNREARMRNRVTNDLLEQADENTGLDNDIDKLFYFFGKAGLCSTEEICDDRILKQYFLSSARSFWYYTETIAQLRRAQGRGDFGDYAEYFAQQE